MTIFTISAEIYPEIVLKCGAGFERRTLRSSLALLFVVGAIGRAGLRKEVGLLRPGPRGPKVLGHQKVR